MHMKQEKPGFRGALRKMDGEELNGLCNALTQLLREKGQDLTITHENIMEHFSDD